MHDFVPLLGLSLNEMAEAKNAVAAAAGASGGSTVGSLPSLVDDADSGNA